MYIYIYIYISGASPARSWGRRAPRRGRCGKSSARGGPGIGNAMHAD